MTQETNIKEEFIVRAGVKTGLSLELEIVGRAEKDKFGTIRVTPYRTDIPLSLLILTPMEMEPK